ncbi:hypothetical protein ACQZ6B_06770 [Agrobacterium vitis]
MENNIYYRKIGKLIFTILASIFIFGNSETSSFAHIKWFQSFNIQEQPVLPGQFMATPTWLLGLALSLPALWACVAIDAAGKNARLGRVLSLIRRPFGFKADDLVRLTIAFWLSWLWMLPEPIWLTPELKAPDASIQWVQLGLAALCLSRRGAGLTGLGLIGLWVGAARQYGTYHLLDYPLFLGFAICLIAISLDRLRVRVLASVTAHRIGLLGATMSWTLMWASMEKWAFADWSLTLLCARPYLTMGLTPEVFLSLSGWFEFGAAAMLLLGGPVASRLSAFALLMIFGSAVLEFGRVDLVGHFPIIAVLAITIWKGNGQVGAAVNFTRKSALKRAVLLPISYIAALFVTGIAYIGGWNFAYGDGTTRGLASEYDAASLLLLWLAAAMILILTLIAAIMLGRRERKRTAAGT